MKTILAFFCTFFMMAAAVSQNDLDTASEAYKKRSPIYDYSETSLNAVDTIPGYAGQTDKLKITGTIYKSDGVTPAKDVIMFIYQPNEDGDYDNRTFNDKKYVYHRAWVKTDANGQYTFYTFVPGASYAANAFPRRRGLKHIHPVIKAPGEEEQKLDAFIFSEDPLLTNRCRKKLDKNGFQGMLDLQKEGSLLVAHRDLVLPEQTTSL
ncbi:hypothetical protein [Mangrovimonas sp. YM274]|uniref:hypothetical protein n=1 Tax=Mangrovimonas sp. YM274 TaxID=3070660 RepID=UPI0027DD2574|nr:hypothetical protein [Mangrovimonas sp. YM274]WMI67333.1 hypothetical protein RBH95_09250 [Mangrovimonas sp. YM274]